ncbi:hypothetical protein LW135_05975 [Helicobacter sp. faydin-H20]|uniref:hypothetical protein n=1 Tax=Helicobacter anatolicus TaxID=2905874 RepID=UPI001E609142|nr:hypothetical protein [Helicobacter anatolicus]MCE3037379.1 hypothetical protein [Helicobacter anatolicus]
MKAFVLWKTLIVLVALISVAFMIPKALSTQKDSMSNFYGSFQNELYAKSVYYIAKACLMRYDLKKCEEDSIDFQDGVLGSYRLQEENKNYIVEISIMHKNPRNLHIIRHFIRKSIKGLRASDV